MRRRRRSGTSASPERGYSTQDIDPGIEDVDARSHVFLRIAGNHREAMMRRVTIRLDVSPLHRCTVILVSPDRKSPILASLSSGRRQPERRPSRISQ
jgi:hypothetical protein